MATIITFPPVGNSARATRWGTAVVILLALIGIAAYLWIGYGTPISDNDAPGARAASVSARNTPITDMALVAP